MLRRIIIDFKSPGVARAILSLLAGWCAVGAWLPWANDPTSAPEWAAALWLDRPFGSPLFLLLVALLCVSTLLCTWGRIRATLLAFGGNSLVPQTPVPVREGLALSDFLRQNRFRQVGNTWMLRRWGLWSSPVFHIGLLALIGGIAIQQAFHDGGAFELSEGATASLADDGVVFNRTRGILAPERPPALQLALSRFDPYRRQEGYAPDRFSRLEAMMDNSSSPVESALDRAHGIEIDGVELFHALPHGLALNLEIEGMGTRSIHLQADSPRNASREVATSDGHTIRFAIETEHELDSLTGTGSLSVRKLEGGQSQEVRTGGSFSFGERQAKLVSVTRWAGYTYQRNPGLGLVWLGIGLVIAGSASLIWPSLVAQCGSEEPGIAGYIDGRWGSEIMVARWLDWPGQKEERS